MGDRGRHERWRDGGHLVGVDGAVRLDRLLRARELADILVDREAGFRALPHGDGYLVVAGGDVADREHAVLAGTAVVVDVDLAALGQIAAEPLGERGVVVGAVHREAAAVLAAGAVFELQRLQPAGVGVVLHARHVLADDLDRVCVELCGGLVAPRRLRAPGQDIHVVGHVQHDHRDVGGRLAVAHHVHRLVDEHVRITVETVVEPLARPRERRIRPLVGEAGGEHDAIGENLGAGRREPESVVVGAVDVGDEAALERAAVRLHLLAAGREELVAGGLLGDADHVVRVGHHRRAAAAAVDQHRFVAQSRPV